MTPKNAPATPLLERLRHSVNLRPEAWENLCHDAADSLVLLDYDRSRLIDCLKDVLETLDKYSDVRDGDDGRPTANPAMSAVMEIEQLLQELGEL